MKNNLLSLYRLRNNLYITIILMILGFSGFSQNVGINTTGAAPNANAGLDVDFNNKGVLIPRVALSSTSSFAPLSAHVAGMLVYNTATAGDVNPGFYYNNGSAWIPGFPSAISTGDMLYWNGIDWVRIPVGFPGQYLQLNGGLTPYWGGAAVLASLSTIAASSITDVMAISGGNLINDNGLTVLSRGVCWNTSGTPTTADSKTTDGSGTGSFTSTLTVLSQSTTYYIRAYAINNQTVSYGNEVIFTTTTPTIPVLLATDAATSITSVSAISGGNLTDNGNATITARGICYSTTNPPTIADTKVIDPGTGLGAFTSSLTGLTSNTVYYVRSYATNSVGAGYGDVISFTTQAVVSTTAITSITTTGSTSGGTITVGGGASITERGVCWSTLANPTIADSKTSDGTTTGIYISAITGCAYTTLYHVRAYATNAGGTVYGSDLTFTTLTPVLATITTTSASSVLGSTATSGGNISNNGGAPITERGIVYSTASITPLNFGSATKIIDPAPGTGLYTSYLTGLLGGTTYSVRSYAITTAGTALGNEITFTTLLNLPVITTTAVSNIGASTASSGGSYTVSGQAGNYWYYGIAISTSSGSLTPTYLSNQFAPPASWTTNLTGLTAGTTYYIRAYIQGSWNGVNGLYVYGNELSFTTSAATAPVVTSTTAITTITDRSANSGGTITSEGGSPITAKGVCWSTSPNPVKGVGNFTSNGIGSTDFTSSITGLTASTIYYVRAYATNAIGTSYGPADVIFTTTHASLYTLGEYVGYGWVVYVDPATGGGLIVSTDISSTAGWGCNNIDVVGVSSALGTGQANTNLILATDLVTRPIAASVANDYSITYSGTTYNDWYLPSSGDWGKIAAIASTVGVINGNNNYYTSSQYLTFLTYASTYWSNGSQITSSGAQRIPGASDYVFTLRVMRDFGASPAVAPTVLSTTAITGITATGGASGGYISSDGGGAVIARGVCWSSTGTPTIADPTTTDGTGMGSFTSAITGLTTGTPYNVRAYATNSAGTSYGPEISFTPVAPGFPNVTTAAISNIAATTATSGGNVTSDGGVAVTARGVCWNTTGTPTKTDPTTTDGTGLGVFVSSITGLTTGTLYYVRAYATNATGTSYGGEVSFTPFTFATVTTDAITSIAATTATSGGNITSDGGSAVTARGVCYSTTTAPTILNFTVADVPGTGTGTFVSNLTGLTNGTPYYVRAYATNGAGTSYGNEEFFTPSGPTVPTVTTDQPTNGTETAVTSGGEVTNDGGSAITARGVVYSSTSFPPTLADPHTTDGSGTGTFTSDITGLTAGNYYTIIAYATNSSGTGYGNEVYYMPVGPPTLAAGQLSYWAGDTYVQIGLNLTSTGGSDITAIGAVWNTSPNPTVEVNGGISTENLAPMPPTAVIQPIEQLTTYYIRTYAINSYGTSYSPEIIFTPGVTSLPTVTTDPILNKIGSVAEGGATVLSDGGDPLGLTFAGLCWSESADPTVEVNSGFTTDGYFGQFYSLMTGLTVGTTYHVRAYATNSTGTGYGADISFTATAATIGQVIQGGSINGIVFSVDGTGSHGLMASPWSMGGEADWGCGTTLLGTGTAIGDGFNNTSTIITDNFNNSCVSTSPMGGFAADVASWQGWTLPTYLPSKDEFDLLWTNASAAGIPLTTATVKKFWSSSEVDGTNVWYFDAETDPLNPVWVNTGAKSAMYTPWPISSF